MSVNAINPADQQKKSSPLAPAIGLGVVGGATGYLAGGKRPTLEKVLEMEPDTFEKAVKDVDDELKAEANKIGSKIKEINEKVKVDSKLQSDFDAKVAAQKLEKDAEELKNLTEANKNYEKKLLETANDAQKEAKKPVFKKLDDLKASKAEYDKAVEALKDADETTALKEAKSAVTAAKEKALRASEDKKVVDFLKKYDEAVEKVKGKKTEKISKLVKDEKLMTAFDKIKKIFPKEGKWKAAGIWAGCAAAAGLIIGLLTNGVNKKEA